MTRQEFINKKFPLICLVLSLAIFVISLTDLSGTGNLNEKAEQTGEEVSERISALNSLINQTLATNPAEKLSPTQIDKDLVIYRYLNDSLIFWNNQFPIRNDDISRKLVFHRLSPFDNRIESQLSDVTDQLTYMSIGTKWYLIKYVDGVWNDRVIAGIEIKNTLSDDIGPNNNGVNPELDLNRQY